MKAYFGMLLLVLIMVGLPSVSTAGPCTDGVDCYCDKVRNPANPTYDPSLLVCEDFEALTLHDNANFGGGAPLWGPWYDDTGLTNGRGHNQYWFRVYGGGSTGFWVSGEPASPTLGKTCLFGACFFAEWRADDAWQGNNRACIDIARSGEFDAESAAMGVPDTPRTNDQRGPWDGQQSFGYRIPIGVTCGPIGGKTFSAVTQIGVTFAYAYPDNLTSISLIDSPWKHEQFMHTSSASFGEAWILGNVGLNPGTGTGGFPFSGGRWTTSQSACNAALAAATILVGQADCTGAPFLRVGPTSSVYQQARDWPLGKWGCVRAYLTGMNTTNMTYQIWFGDGTTERLIFHMTGFNAASAMLHQSYNFYDWNAYANSNSGVAGDTPTTAPARRWVDNWHLRNGVPVSCAQIGFPSSGGDTQAPLAPTGLSAG